jgi:23S rRNA (cytidine1920-2'-O)/16S rRNA (cytidine1409-2'-O)-methyltransferase
VARQRLDRALVERGLVGSRQEAARAIEEHRVLVGGVVAEKPSRQVAPADPIIVAGGGPRFVSRGGAKLDHAIERFGIVVEKRVALDAGSATGGFTDCLLQRGASCVVAVDVGYGQLHERLRADERVHSLERTNVRDLDPQAVREIVGGGGLPSLLSADLSFISLRPLVPVLLGLVDDEADLVLLCKPQFEVGRAIASRGHGVVRSREDRQFAVVELCGTLEAAGAAIMGIVSSPLLGPAGNAEFLLHVRTSGEQGCELDAAIDAALDEAEALE